MDIEELTDDGNAFTTAITEQLGGNDLVPIGDDGEVVIPDGWDDPDLINNFVKEFGKTINDPSIREAEQGFTPNSFYDYLNMELALSCNGAEVQFGRDKAGLPIGTTHDNPILDT